MITFFTTTIIMFLCISTVNTSQASLEVQLARAIERGDATLVRNLLEGGANVNAKVEHWTPLDRAAHEGYDDIVTILLDKKADLTTGILIKAAQRGRVSTIELLLSRGAPIDATDSWGQTALYCAAFYNNSGAVTALLNAGADMNASREHPFLCRAERGDVGMVSLLLKHQPNLVSEHGTQAIMGAAYQRYQDLNKVHPDNDQQERVIQLLFDKGASPPDDTQIKRTRFSKKQVGLPAGAQQILNKYACSYYARVIEHLRTTCADFPDDLAFTLLEIAYGPHIQQLKPSILMQVRELPLD